MAEPLSDEHLARVLASVGDHLVVPEVDDAWSPASSGRRRGGRRAVGAVAAAVLGVTVAGGVGITPVREAVADWFGLGSTGFERVAPGGADPTGLPPLEAGLPIVSRTDAEAVLGRPLPHLDPSRLGLGDPERIALPPEGGVLLGWDRGATSLWVRTTEDPAATRMRKLLDDSDAVQPVAGLGEGAVSVTGDHVLATPHRRVAAGSVVLWIDEGIEFRLESDLGVDAMVSIARGVDPTPAPG
jgi:hypothetical protein